MADDDDRRDGDDQELESRIPFTLHAITLSFEGSGAQQGIGGGTSLKKVLITTELPAAADAHTIYRLDNARSHGPDETEGHPNHNVKFDHDEPLYVALWLA